MKDVKHEKKCHIGLIQTKTKRGLRIYFSESPPPPLENLDLPLQIPEKTSFHSWKSWKNSAKLCDTLWKFQEFHIFFFSILENSMKFHLDFSGIAHYCSCMPIFFKLWFGVYHMHHAQFVKTWYLSASVTL